MAIRFYNTLTRTKEVFRPLHDKRVNLFVCGLTVYDVAHIGHARTYLVYDMLARYLRALGYRLFFLENITDISDKIIKRAEATKEKPEKIARRFEQDFLRDMHALGIRSVDRYARASDFIPEIINQVQRLIKKGFAYAVYGNVYFRTRKFSRYGRLSHQNINKVGRLYNRAMIAEGEIDPAQGKERAIDFALWKASKRGEPKWKSPWGWGRPGWHIEDTAITEKFFGPQYDIHGGGIGLIFPHHECEIAQQEAATNKRPFVRYWLHAGHLKIDNAKMSKSLSNFITIQNVLTKTTPEIFRLFVAQTHYRSPINYSDALLQQAEATRNRLIEFRIRLSHMKPRTEDNAGINRAIAKTREAFYDALADDFNTPKALAEIFKLVARLNPVANRNGLNTKSRNAINALFREVDSIFGIIGKLSPLKISAQVKRLVAQREKMRREKQWQEADKVRAKIQALGWYIEDTAAGPLLKKQS